jgi:hypothetical protein
VYLLDKILKIWLKYNIEGGYYYASSKKNSEKDNSEKDNKKDSKKSKEVGKIAIGL